MLIINRTISYSYCYSYHSWCEPASKVTVVPRMFVGEVQTISIGFHAEFHVRTNYFTFGLIWSLDLLIIDNGPFYLQHFTKIM